MVGSKASREEKSLSKAIERSSEVTEVARYTFMHSSIAWKYGYII